MGKQPESANGEASGPKKKRTAFQAFMSEQLSSGKSKNLKEAQAAWREHKASA